MNGGAGLLVRPRVRGKADDGDCLLAGRLALLACWRGANNSALALVAITGLVLRQMVYLVSEFNGCNKFR